MPGLYTLVATRTDGETLTAAKYNGDHQNHIDNQELQKTDDFSATVGQMQTTTDPGEVGTESLATDASGEIARLRFALKETKDAISASAVAQWYSTPTFGRGMPSVAQARNLLRNSDLEVWNAGTAVAPDLWVLSGAGATVARDGTNFKTGAFAASVTRAGTDAVLQEDAITEAGGQGYIRSRQYTFAAWVRATVAARVRLRLNDGIGSSFSSYHSGGGTLERLTVTRTLDATATALNAGLSVDTGDTNGQIDTAMLVEGADAPSWARHPDDGLTTNGAFDNVVFKSGTSFKGTLDHNNSADRAYTWPNQPGQVRIDSQVDFLEDFIAIDAAIPAPGGDFFGSIARWRVFSFTGTSGTPTYLANLPGVIRSVGAVGAGTGIILWNAPAAVTYTPFLASKNPRLKARWARNGIGANRRFIGFVVAPPAGGGDPTDAIFFRHTDTNIFAVCRASSTETTLDTGVATADGTYHTGTLEVRGGGTSVDVYVDDVLKGTISANIPSVNLAVASYTESGTATGSDTDYLYVTQER